LKEEFDHIDDLIGKCLSGEAKEEEYAQLQNWRAQSESNEAYYKQLQLIFDKAKTIEQTQLFDTDRAWRKVKSKMVSPKGKQVKLIPFWNVIRIAAILLVSVGIGYFAYQWLNTPDEIFLLTADKSIVRDSLPDGSYAVLNKQSKIQYAYNKRSNQRKIVLEGEAFFEVNHQEAKPFIIETGEVIIEDIGTSFNVMALPERSTIEVYVESGEVAFYTLKDAGINLVAGETGIYHKESKSFARLLKTDTNRLAYKTGIFVFRNSDLESIIADLNAVYDAKIRLGNVALKNCRLNVTFRNERIEDIVEIIAETLGLKVNKEGGDYVLDGMSCGS